MRSPVPVVPKRMYNIENLDALPCEAVFAESDDKLTVYHASNPSAVGELYTHVVGAGKHRCDALCNLVWAMCVSEGVVYPVVPTLSFVSGLSGTVMDDKQLLYWYSKSTLESHVDKWRNVDGRICCSQVVLLIQQIQKQLLNLLLIQSSFLVFVRMLRFVILENFLLLRLFRSPR